MASLMVLSAAASAPVSRCPLAGVLARPQPALPCPRRSEHLPRGFLAITGVAITARAATKKAAKGARVPLSDDDKGRLKFQADMCKKYGEGAVMTMDTERIAVETFSTGSLTLDMALGGGLPRGRIIEVYGPEQSGKTTLALHCIANVQKSGGHCAFIDAECALDLDYATNLGVDTSKWLMCNPGSAEAATDMAVDLAESSLYSLIVVDSVAALTPEEEQEKDMSGFTVGLLARLMSKFMRKITDPLRRNNCSLLLINQLRANIGGYGAPEVTTGGNAIRYACTIRMMIRSPKSGLIGPVSNPHGIRCHVKVTKNKLAAPHRSCEFSLFFGRGISWESSVLEAAIEKGFVEQKGAWFVCRDFKQQGKDRFVQLLEEEPELLAELEEQCRGSEEEDEDAEEESDAEVETSVVEAEKSSAAKESGAKAKKKDDPKAAKSSVEAKKSSAKEVKKDAVAEKKVTPKATKKDAAEAKKSSAKKVKKDSVAEKKVTPKATKKDAEEAKKSTTATKKKEAKKSTTATKKKEAKK